MFKGNVKSKMVRCGLVACMDPAKMFKIVIKTSKGKRPLGRH
jgi:hypothetical protein